MGSPYLIWSVHFPSNPSLTCLNSSLLNRSHQNHTLFSRSVFDSFSYYGINAYLSVWGVLLLIYPSNSFHLPFFTTALKALAVWIYCLGAPCWEDVMCSSRSATGKRLTQCHQPTLVDQQQVLCESSCPQKNCCLSSELDTTSTPAHHFQVLVRPRPWIWGFSLPGMATHPSLPP